MALHYNVSPRNGGNTPHDVSDTSDSFDTLLPDSMLTLGGMYSNTMHPDAAFPPREVLLASRRRSALWRGSRRRNPH